MLIRLDKLSRENRRLKTAFVGTSLLAAVLLVGGQPSNRFLVLAQTASPPGQASAARGMSFDDQRILIGMTRTEAMNRLSKCCKVTGRGNAYFIWERGTTAEILGAIWFSGDNVTSLKRDLEYYPSADAVKLARGVYHELLNIGDQGEHAVVLSAKTTELANGTSQNIELAFPTGRSLVIEVASVDDPNLTTAVSLSEYQR